MPDFENATLICANVLKMDMSSIIGHEAALYWIMFPQMISITTTGKYFVLVL